MATTTTTTVRPPEVGAKATDFTLHSTRGDNYTLSTETKKGPVVVLFLPGAFTGVCTKESCNIRDAWAEYQKMNAQVVAVTQDTKQVQKAFVDTHKIPFPLVSDWDHKTIAAYGTTWNSGWAHTTKRAVFVVDKNMTVRWRWVSEDAGVEPPYAEIQKALQQAK